MFTSYGMDGRDGKDPHVFTPRNDDVYVAAELVMLGLKILCVDSIAVYLLNLGLIP